jgi:hypothetical protein
MAVSVDLLKALGAFQNSYGSKVLLFENNTD